MNRATNIEALRDAAEFSRRLTALTPDLRLKLVVNLRRDHPDNASLMELADAIERWAKTGAKS